VQVLLSQPVRWRVGGEVREASRERRSGYEYLLSGLAWCGRCGWQLRGNQQWRRGGVTVPSYACRRVGTEPSHVDGGPCGGVSISAVPLDESVRDACLELARRPEARRVLASGDEGRRAALSAEIAAADAVATDLATMYGRGEIGAGEWRAGREAALRRSREARAALAAIPSATIDSEQVLDVSWPTAALGDRRRFVAFFVEGVRVAPLRGPLPGKWPYNEAGRRHRVVIDWRA
jgi:hypothetical protein